LSLARHGKLRGIRDHVVEPAAGALEKIPGRQYTGSVGLGKAVAIESTG
jgi:hypothetical protein